MNYRHARNSHARLLDRYAALFETAAVATLKRVDVACIALRLCAVQAHLRQAIRTQKAKVLRAAVRPWPRQTKMTMALGERVYANNQTSEAHSGHSI